MPITKERREELRESLKRDRRERAEANQEMRQNSKPVKVGSGTIAMIKLRRLV